MLSINFSESFLPFSLPFTLSLSLYFPPYFLFLFPIVGNMKSVAKLEFLVVCRFAKLSMDEQRIARTASIIGTTFTADVLNNALPKQLRPYMTIILHSLVDTHWLNANSEQNPNGMITVEYSFSHPLLHKTLYDLTPSSVKSKIHLSIAKYIEKIYFEDKLYFMSLGYRKSLFFLPFLLFNFFFTDDF